MGGEAVGNNDRQYSKVGILRMVDLRPENIQRWRVRVQSIGKETGMPYITG